MTSTRTAWFCLVVAGCSPDDADPMSGAPGTETSTAGDGLGADSTPGDAGSTGGDGEGGQGETAPPTGSSETGEPPGSDDASESSGDASGSSGDGPVGAGDEDDFERRELGPNWEVIFPPAPNDQVQIIDGSDLGMAPGPQGFFLVNWVASEFTDDQFCEATLPLDATADWAHQVYVRWREADRARYGFGFDNDPGQKQFGNWYFKYDGVPSNETRYFALAPGDGPPDPGDTLRVEVEGYTLRGYHNGVLVLEATDEDPSRIAEGRTGLAARWATGNLQTNEIVKVWESWSGGDL